MVRGLPGTVLLWDPGLRGGIWVSLVWDPGLREGSE